MYILSLLYNTVALRYETVYATGLIYLLYNFLLEQKELHYNCVSLRTLYS
jgi:hypothetical protein